MNKTSKLLERKSIRERLEKEIENEKAGKYYPSEHVLEALAIRLRFQKGYRRFYDAKSGSNI
jgi:hypothetical protein